MDPNEMISLGASPVVGFGQSEIARPVVAPSSPWALALATSVVGAATGWVIEEVARRTIRKKNR